MTKSWKIERLLPIVRELYEALGERFDDRFYHPTPARRFFQNSDDARRAGRRSRNPRYTDVLGEPQEPGESSTPLLDPEGSIEIKAAGWVDLPRLIEALRRHFSKLDVYTDATFDHDQLRAGANDWLYKKHRARRVIFCEGVGLRNNPWFRDLPIKPIKGETIALTCPNLELSPGIYHSKKWLLAYARGGFRLGATYDEEDFSHATTERARQNLLTDASAFIPSEYRFEIEAQLAGLRPSTSDTRPLVGQHPHQTGLFVFNGLGSKGASIAPWLSQHFVEYLIEQKTLDPEVDIRRFGRQVD